MRPYFANAVTEGSAYRHPDRPSKFDCLDILTDDLAILGLQAFQPFPERFSARFRAEENRRDSLTLRPLRWRQCGFGCWRIFPLRCHYLVYHIRYNRAWSKELRSVPALRSSEPNSLNFCSYRGLSVLTPGSDPLEKWLQKWLHSGGLGSHGPPKLPERAMS